METPTARRICDEAGISPSYAHMILSGERRPSRPLAIHILRRTGWRHPILEGLTDEQIAMLETVEPWVPPSERPENAVAA